MFALVDVNKRLSLSHICTHREVKGGGEREKKGRTNFIGVNCDCLQGIVTVILCAERKLLGEHLTEKHIHLEWWFARYRTEIVETKIFL